MKAASVDMPDRQGRVFHASRPQIAAATIAGVVAGCWLSYLIVLPALLVFTAFGFALGYAARAYVSYRRRARIRRQALGWR